MTLPHAYPLPVDEEQRLANLHSYGVPGTGPEEAFNDLALLTARFCEAPIAAVTLVDQNWVSCIGEVGLNASGGPREASICTHTIMRPHALLVIPDAAADARFAQNPSVIGELGVRFYAGASLVSPDGHALGSLCVIDRLPRPEGLSVPQEKALRALARQAVAQLELRRKVAALQRAETAWQREERRFRAFMDHTEVVAWAKDHRFRYVYGNAAFERLFGRSIAEVLGRTDFDLLPAEHAAVTRAHDAQVLSHGQPLQTLELVPDVDGRPRWWQVCKFPFRPEGDRSGRDTLVGGMAVDVTARKESEAALGAALAEKVTLLREIHHRVKNNLQTVSSLLALQIRSLGQDEGSTTPLRECQGRVRAMAMLHEKLYGDGGVERVDFGDYLGGLLQELLRSARPAGVDVRLERDLQAGVHLPMEVAVPLGLIANELIANGLKHAFNGRPCGAVRVALCARPGGLHRLTVSDDGRGLPAGFSIPLPGAPTPPGRNGFGLRLVGLLAKQLGATVTAGPNAAVTDGGTVFTVDWRQAGCGRTRG